MASIILLPTELLLLMDINTAIIQRRTIRRFLPKPVDKQTLLDITSLSRLYASGGNLQPIRYAIVTEQATLDKVFDTLRWAAYLPDFEIQYQQRPMAYIILTSEKENCQFDLGAAATTLMLAAEEKGLATCCLGAFDRKSLSEFLPLQHEQKPLLVVALGYAAQRSKTVDYCGDVKYYEDADGCLCVPKRTLDDVVTVF